MRTATRISLTIVSVAIAVVATGCTSSSSPKTGGSATTGPEPTVTVTVPAPSGESTPTPTCGPASGREAAAAGIAKLHLPEGLDEARWDAAGADYTGYDACASLSWSVVTLEYATSSTPQAILLFHRGSYLGTATSTPYSFTPEIRRVSGASIAVTYKYALPSDDLANPRGRVDATYTWNAATQKVTMTGYVPPSE